MSEINSVNAHSAMPFYNLGERLLKTQHLA